CLILKVSDAMGSGDEIPAEALKRRSLVTGATSDDYRPARASRSAGTSLTDTSLTPMFGTSSYQGAGAHEIENDFSSGLALEVPLSGRISTEVDFGYGKYHIGEV